jgi:hypothetical protein
MAPFPSQQMNKKLTIKHSIFLAFIIALLPAVLFLIAGYGSIVREADAQGAIALVILPFISLAFFFICSALLYSLIEFWKIIYHRSVFKGIKKRLFIAISAFTLSTLIISMVSLQQYELAVAKSPNSSPEKLEELYKGISIVYNHDIAMRLAENISTPPDVQAKLSKDKYSSVRYRVAANPNSPLIILENLSEDREWPVRSWLTSNPSVPNELLSKLQKDSHNHVRMNAKARSKERGIPIEAD